MVAAREEAHAKSAQEGLWFVLLLDVLVFMEGTQCSDLQGNLDAGTSAGVADQGGSGRLVQCGVQTPCWSVGRGLISRWTGSLVSCFSSCRGFCEQASLLLFFSAGLWQLWLLAVSVCFGFVSWWFGRCVFLVHCFWQTLSCLMKYAPSVWSQKKGHSDSYMYWVIVFCFLSSWACWTVKFYRLVWSILMAAHIWSVLQWPRRRLAKPYKNWCLQHHFLLGGVARLSSTAVALTSSGLGGAPSCVGCALVGRVCCFC